MPFVYSFGHSLMFIFSYAKFIHRLQNYPTIRFLGKNSDVWNAFLTIRHFFIFYVNKNIKNLST